MNIIMREKKQVVIVFFPDSILSQIFELGREADMICAKCA